MTDCSIPVPTGARSASSATRSRRAPRRAVAAGMAALVLGALAGCSDASGGKADPTPKQDMGFMYGRSFEDPDGHIWENVYMNMAAVPEGETVAEQPVA